MIDLLSVAARPLLRDFAAARAAVVFDFDGTLAPIVADPEAAQLSPRTRMLLRRVAERYPTAVLSGRGQKDVAARLHDVPIAHVVGNHGAEASWTEFHSRRIADRVAGWCAALRTRLATAEGVLIEDKRYSLAVHYRRAPDREEARQRILSAVRDLRGLRTTDGKAVINVVADDAPDKGVALMRLRTMLRCQRVLYVGDDTNDEDAFARGDGERTICVRVGRSSRSHATHYVRGQREVDRLLVVLARLRVPARDGERVPAAARSVR